MQFTLNCKAFLCCIIVLAGEFYTKRMIGMPGIKSSGRLRLSLALVLLLGIHGSVLAKEQPDAGRIVSGIRDHQVIVPDRENIQIEVPEEQEVSPSSNGSRVKIFNIHIAGQSLFKESILQDLVKDSFGQELALTDMQRLAGRIESFFHGKGYLVAGAYIPAQELKNGELEIQMVVGQYETISLQNHSKLSNAVALPMLSRLKTGDYVRNDELERTLLLLNDLGIASRGTLIPGKSPGTTDLIVELTDSREKTGQVGIDNYGNRFTGQQRTNISVKLNNLFGGGEAVGVGGGLTGEGYHDGNLKYTVPVGKDGAKLEFGYYQMQYNLGKEFASLDAGGRAQIATINATYPIIRSRNKNLFLQAGYQSKIFRDFHVSQAAAERNNREGIWNIGFTGDSRDRWGGGAITSFGLNFYSGSLSTNDLTTSLPGSYVKTTIDYYRLQFINPRLEVLLGFTGQSSNRSLDNAEKLFLGGINGIKAYAQGEGYGDQGYILTGEFHWNMPTPTCQLAVYIENGKAANRANRMEETSRYTLSGAGLGLIYNDRQNYSIRLDYAWQLFSSEERARSGRFWLRCNQSF